ncbi:hypothetical protein RINTHM_10650 [Richelia intracellularis HM01]|nr:hypothetical protein RINTHM_10650 [Richelia intracellularis HM01]
MSAVYKVEFKKPILHWIKKFHLAIILMEEMRVNRKNYVKKVEHL